MLFWLIFVPAMTVWCLDSSGVVCNPQNHIFNGHAAWHLLDALSFWFLFRYYEQFDIPRKALGAGRRTPGFTTTASALAEAGARGAALRTVRAASADSVIIRGVKRMLCPAAVSLAVFLTAHVGSAVEPTNPAFAQCHLLCTVEDGRVDSRPGPSVGGKFIVRNELVGLAPLGVYLDNSYRRLPSGSRASAVEWLPSIAWRPREDLQFSLSFPWEANQSSNVITPSLHPSPGSHHEIAPGRLSATVAKRLAVPADWDSDPWIGVGYAISESIGTVNVAPLLGANPELGADVLGIGTNDLFLTADMLRRRQGRFELAVGVEARAHAIPHLSRLFALTGAYRVWAGYEVSSRVSAGVRFSGFRTIVLADAVGADQSNGLTVMPALAWSATARLRLTGGLATQVPGSALNQNALQTAEVHLAAETRF